MRVLVLGSGGREHALAWALGSLAVVDEVHAAPGNPGIAGLGPLPPVAVADRGRGGPGRRLGRPGRGRPRGAAGGGLADALEAPGPAVFGPVAAGARLEGSKAWMKDVLADAGVPTARYGVVHRRPGGGRRSRSSRRCPASTWSRPTGSPPGKGVVVTESPTEAEAAVPSYLSGAAFGAAGRTAVIEEGLTGPELSLLVLCDGRPTASPLAPAQDFKRTGDRDPARTPVGWAPTRRSPS